MLLIYRGYDSPLANESCLRLKPLICANSFGEAWWSLQVASTSGPTTNESAGEVPIVLDTFAGAGSAKRKLPMQCQVGCWSIFSPFPSRPPHGISSLFYLCMELFSASSWRVVSAWRTMLCG